MIELLISLGFERILRHDFEILQNSCEVQPVTIAQISNMLLPIVNLSSHILHESLTFNKSGLSSVLVIQRVKVWGFDSCRKFMQGKRRALRPCQAPPGVRRLHDQIYRGRFSLRFTRMDCLSVRGVQNCHG